ncbi:uncharacterized protein LOC134231545 [Saccostrea cucullata]|uniref:uncharacterized protein LOC134231545 n=1 Tax=Saccostrea cuccullata TaxID=36930 RepID=UPI002ED085DA
MDIPLLYSLLRNICGISSHTNGWGNDPNPTDRSLSANIERMRIARNQCVHSSSPVLSKTDFNTIWSNVRSAVVNIDSFLNNGNKYEREVDFLRYETMDPDRDRHYIEELRKQAEEDASTREKVHLLKRDLEMRDTDRIENQNKMLKIVDEITNTTVPKNVKGMSKHVLKENDKRGENFVKKALNFPII